MKNGDAPIGLNQIETASISSSASDFENTIGLDPFELSLEEVEQYRPTVFRCLSEEMESNSSLQFMKVHDSYTINVRNEPIFPTDITFKALYLVRNPLDVCVSYANHSSMPFEKMIKTICNKKAIVGGIKGLQLRQHLLSWSDHVNSWLGQREIDVMPIRYEDMKSNPIKTFEQTIRFLELEYDDRRLIKAIGFSDFKLLQQMEQTNGFRERKEKCQNFFWSGSVGNYRNHLTQSQIDCIVDYHKDMMQAFNYLDNHGHLTV